MKDTLLALEDRLALGQDFERLLHPDFFEFGRSGRRWSRAEVLAELAGNGAPSERRAEQAIELAPGCWHLSWHGLGARPAWRSSIWQLGPSGWQLRFHQATALP